MECKRHVQSNSSDTCSPITRFLLPKAMTVTYNNNTSISILYANMYKDITTQFQIKQKQIKLKLFVRKSKEIKNQKSFIHD